MKRRSVQDTGTHTGRRQRNIPDSRAMASDSAPGGSKQPAPAPLVREVRTVLKAFSSVPVEVPGDEMELHRDLGIDEEHGLKALAAPFQRIAREYVSTAVVTREECTELEEVKDCISLVAERANFTYKGEQ